MPERWEWDESPFTGAAAHYERGRLPYPGSLTAVATAALGLDGSGRLLDVGCGPGVVTRLLAPGFEAAVGVDADPSMVEEAARRAAALGVPNVTWVTRRAEALPGGLGRFRVATFGQSFHWLDRARVAATVATMLEPGGALVLVKHWSTVGDPVPGSPHPAPPHDAIAALVERHLDPARRLDAAATAPLAEDDASVLAAAGLSGPEVVPVPGGEVLVLDVDDLVARVHSTSSSAPDRFGAELDTFDRELVALLRETSPAGAFAERVRDAVLEIWRTPVARTAARVLVLDGRGDVLLLRGFDPSRPDRGSWWFTPGGGIDPGESAADAARRELAEETGLRIDALGPVRFERRATFEFEHVRYHQHEHYFVVRTERFEPTREGWTAVERRSVLEHKWWSVAELGATDAVVYPEDLVDRLRALDPDPTPDAVRPPTLPEARRMSGGVRPPTP